MSDKKILLTSAWLAELTEELRFLREEKRVDIAQKLKEAISYWDLSEDAEYQEARDEQAQVELRIAELEEILKLGNYSIIEDDKTAKKKKWINVGATVVLSDIHSKEKISYLIVGSQEANILENKISNESPLGRSMIGKWPGDGVTFVAPAGKKEYTILEVK